MSRVQRFHAGFEEHLDHRLPGALKDWDFSYRAPLIKADLELLGYRPPENAVGTSLPWNEVDFEDEATLSGWLYVIEGSALGATLINRHLGNVLGQEMADKLRFFKPYGDNPGAHWRAFQKRLCLVADGGERTQVQIIKAADTAFEWYHRVAI